LQLIQKNSPLVVNSHKLKFIFKKKAGRRHRKHRQTTVENGAKTGFEEACVAVVLLSSFIAFSALFLMDCYFFELFMRFFFCFFCIVWCFEFFPMKNDGKTVHFCRFCLRFLKVWVLKKSPRQNDNF
jgi:hypothetical protein